MNAVDGEQFRQVVQVAKWARSPLDGQGAAALNRCAELPGQHRRSRPRESISKVRNMQAPTAGQAAGLRHGYGLTALTL